MTAIRITRLTSGDGDLARELFTLMDRIFGARSENLSDGYLARLLSCGDFWALVALIGDEVVGGLTAHTLPMTRSECAEIFIYDIAVRDANRRCGIGRRLVLELREAAAAAGVDNVFVAADNEDVHALDFYRALGGTQSPVTMFTFDSLTHT